MRTGDVIFVRGHSFISKIIRFFDKGEFTHVAIAVTPYTVLEVDRFTKVRIINMEYEDYEIVSLNLNSIQERKVLEEGGKLVGKRYDYGQVLWELLKDLFKLKGRNQFNNPNRFICSELVGRVLVAAGLLQDSSSVRDCTPNELYDLVQHLAEMRRPS